MFGREKLPGELTPKLERDERILAWSRLGESAGGADATPRVIVATNRGLWLPLAGRPAQRLGWHEIHKATWADGVLKLVAADSRPLLDDSDISVSVDTTEESYRLANPGNLPKRIRERVTASVAYTSLHKLAGGAVRVVGRRVSGRDGLFWFVRYEGGLDGSDPGVIATTAELVMSARESINEPD